MKKKLLFVSENGSIDSSLSPVLPREKMFDEAWLQELLIQNPSLMPTGEIDDVWADLIPIGRARFSENHSIVIGGKAQVSNINLKFYPHNLLQYFVDQIWPDKLEFFTLPIDSEQGRPAHQLITVPGVGRHVNFLIMSAFVHYFESNRSDLESRFGNDCQNWPNVWNFGRVVRNAFAHGGKLKIDNEDAIPVSWLTLTYSPSDNGREIIQNDISCVEMILLMEDMDQLI